MYDHGGRDCGEPLAVGGVVLECRAKRRAGEKRRQRPAEAAREINAAARIEGERKVARHPAENPQKRGDRGERRRILRFRIADHLIRAQGLSRERLMQARKAGPREQMFDDERPRRRHSREDLRFLGGCRPEHHVSRLARKRERRSPRPNERGNAEAGTRTASKEVPVLFARAAADPQEIVALKLQQGLRNRREIVHHDQALQFQSQLKLRDRKRPSSIGERNSIAVDRTGNRKHGLRRTRLSCRREFAFQQRLQVPHVVIEQGLDRAKLPAVTQGKPGLRSADISGKDGWLGAQNSPFVEVQQSFRNGSRSNFIALAR